MKALLIFGGKSFEHDISIITAQIIYNKAKHTNFQLLPVYIDKNDEWFFYTQNNMNVTLFNNFENNYKKRGFVRAYIKQGSNYLYYKSGLRDKKIMVDAALLCTHGGKGEDGHLTAILEASNIAPSTGSMAGLGICMDKVLTKYALKGLKLPVIDYFDFDKDDLEKGKDEIMNRAQELGYPLILKPASLGSSIGIKVVYSWQELEEAAIVATQFDEHILVEKALLEGMEEYNVACLKTENEILVSPVDKPKREHEILSFEDKYIGSSSDPRPVKRKKGGSYLKEKTFEKIDSKLEEKLKNLAKTTYQKLGLFGPVRIDFIKQGAKIYVNELNTIPGSLGYYFFIPKPYKDMNEYVNSILNYALKTYKKQNSIKKEFITKLI